MIAGVAELVYEGREEAVLPAPLDSRTVVEPDDAGVDSDVEVEAAGAGETVAAVDASRSSSAGGLGRARGYAPTGTATFGGLNSEWPSLTGFTMRARCAL